MKGSLSGPSSSLAGPSLIGDSGSEQTWHMSSSMHYACSSVKGCIRVKDVLSCPSSGFAGPSLIRDFGPDLPTRMFCTTFDE